jgi:hypothetical protein
MSKDKQHSDEHEPIDGATGKAEPTPGAFGRDGRRIDLSKLRDVRIELARVYRQMDAGTIKTQEGTRLACVLKTIHDIGEQSEHLHIAFTASSIGIAPDQEA